MHSGESSFPNLKVMIKNYLKTAWRNLIRDRRFSLINIAGLSLGLSCSLMIFLWVADERSVDGFHANSKRLYQVYRRHTEDGRTDGSYNTPGLLAAELKRTIPEIEMATPVEQDFPFPYTLSFAEKALKGNGTYVSADFFRMFSFPLLSGSPAFASNTPGGIAISEKMAVGLFGSAAAATGKTIRFENREDLQVIAVFANTPANSSLHFDFLRCWQDYTRDNAWVNNWGSTSPATYILLKPGADARSVDLRLKNFVQQRSGEKNSVTETGIQKMSEKYLHSDFADGRPAGGRIDYVYLFTLVAVLILGLACINFMNLATARATKRAREVGIRKVMGAGRLALVSQFIGEAVLLTALAIVLSLALVSFLLPFFNRLTGKELFLPFTRPLFWVGLTLLTGVTGMVAGSYPALYLSALQPIRVLKDRFIPGAGAGWFRKGLVVLQFSLSIVLMVGMVVIYKQMQFIQNRNLGYDRENLLYIPIEGALKTDYSLFRERSLSIPGITGITEMRETPTFISHSKGSIGWAGKDPSAEVSFSDAAVGYDFAKTLRLKMVSGRDFSRSLTGDSIEYILNESAVKKTGYKDPIGKPFWIGERRGVIIGVVKDFHFASLHQSITPLCLRLDKQPPWGTILVRLQAASTKKVLAGLGAICKEMNPAIPFSYQFSDEEYQKLYKSEQVVSSLINGFAILAIGISCLGLFGLATFMAAQRTKEIGIRKVLGASVTGIVGNLCGTFLKPVLISFLIALPLGWWVMSHWLQQYAYKVTLNWEMFALATVLTLGIALIPVAMESTQAARRNPVKSLRAE